MTTEPEALHVADLLELQWQREAEVAAALGEQHAEIERLRADAKRYRWLRQERYMFREGAAITCDAQSETAALWVKCPVANDAQEVDAAIDAAMFYRGS